MLSIKRNKAFKASMARKGTPPCSPSTRGNHIKGTSMSTDWGGAWNAKEKLSPVAGNWGLPSRTPAARAMYYDPSKEVASADGFGALEGGKTTGDEAARYRNRWLFTPATVLLAMYPEAGVVLIQTRGGEVHSDAPASTEEAPARTLGKKSLNRKMPVGLNMGELETRLLSCNPLLESFGNAATLKNDNSSRFGNFTKIQFDKRGNILGSPIQNYLLEKTRIVDHAKRERSYHVFYQMLAGASSALKKELRLEKGVVGFECLRGSSMKEGDAQGFELTKECLTNIGIQPEEEAGDDEHAQEGIFTLVATVMHLLNVGFQKAGRKGDACMIDEKTRGSLNIAGELLGVDADALEKAIVSKIMAVHSIETTMQRTVDQAYDKTAALGKALYSLLFLWLVAKLNTTISAPQRHMFEVEQIDYKKEQIGWSYILFTDNKEQEEAPATNLGATAAAVPGISPRPSRNVEVSLLRRSRDGSVGGPTRDSCSGSNGEEWWSMLAHRTGDESVPQALMSHGLPPAERRSIWGAWTARCTRAEPRMTVNLFEKTSIKRIIAQDVQRTKIYHHLFSAGGQGFNMLTRVLLRCAELGALEEVGYVQGMSHMAGFLLVTIADAVSAERDCAVNGGIAAPAPGTFAGGGTGTDASPLEVIETECVQGMLGMVAMQGGILSKDLCGLHANTDLLGEVMSKFSPKVMDHLRRINVDLIFLTPRWFIGIYAGSMASHTLVARIWDLYLWYGRRGPAVLVWVALSLLHGGRRHIMESADLPAAVKAVHRHVHEVATFGDLVRQAPADLGQVVAAWEVNRRIARPESGLTDEEGGDVTISSTRTWKVWRCLRRWGAACKRWVGSS